MATGATNAAIAEALTLAVRTVEDHIRNICAKLDVHIRVEAVNRARDCEDI